MKSQNVKKTRKPSNTKWKLLDGTPVTQKQVADFLHITDRQIRYLIPQMPQHAKNNLGDFLEWYYQREIMVTDADGTAIKLSDLKEEELFHKTRKIRHDANRSKISEEKERFEFEINKGDFVEREQVTRRIAEISKQFSKKLFALPSRVVSLIMQADSPDEVTKVLNTELRKITEEIDTWQIFP